MFGRSKKFFALLLTAVILTGCGNKLPEEPPEIGIAAGNKTLHTISEKLYWNDAVYCSASPYGSAEIWLESMGEPEYFPVGTSFSVTLPKKTAMPDNVEVNDVLVVSDGGMKNAETAAVSEIIPTVNEDGISFSICEHGTPDSYDPSRSLYRCIEIILSWENNECKYTFCINEKNDK